MVITTSPPAPDSSLEPPGALLPAGNVPTSREEVRDHEPSRGRRGARPRRAVLRWRAPGWLRRRGWLVVVAAVLGTGAGFAFSAATNPAYAAEATLAVPAGSTQATPGSANEADALAISYAAVLPGDDALLRPVAAALGIPVDTLSSRLSISVEGGTSVLVVRYTAGTGPEAVRGVNTIARYIVGQERGNSVVPLDTLNLVQLATSAVQSNVLAKYGIVIGSFLGLLAGTALALGIERIDPRIDGSGDVDEVRPRRGAVSVPGELTVPEFGYAVLHPAGARGSDRSEVTLAPLRRADASATSQMGRTLSACYPGTRVHVGNPLETGMAHQLRSGTTLVLVVRGGERKASLRHVVDRLRLVGNEPDWIAILDRHAPAR